MSALINYSSSTHWTMMVMAGEPKTVQEMLRIRNIPKYIMMRNIKQLVKHGLAKKVTEDEWYPHYALTEEGVTLMWDLPGTQSTAQLYEKRSLI